MIPRICWPTARPGPLKMCNEAGRLLGADLQVLRLVTTIPQRPEQNDLSNKGLALTWGDDVLHRVPLSVQQGMHPEFRTPSTEITQTFRFFSVKCQASR